MDLLIFVILSGMAAGYVSELVAMIYDRAYLRVLFTLAASAASLYLLGVWGIPLVIATFASAFFAASFLKLINRPVVLNNTLRR